MPKELIELRAHIDAIDTTLLLLLAQRFQVTEKVGRLKRDGNLPSRDSSREEEQLARLQAQASTAGVSPLLVENVWRLIIDEVVSNHQAVQSKATYTTD